MRFLCVLLTSFLLSDIAVGYVLFSPAAVRQCSIAKIKRKSFNVCLGGSASTADLARAKENVQRAVLAWLRVFKMIDKDITPTVTLTCEDPALTITLMNGSGRSYAQTSRAWLYNEVPYGTWTHELGHALVGLSDTYSGSTAGQCQRGQPESLMCWGGYGPRRDHNVFSTLWNDDITGAVVNYQTLYGVTTPSVREFEFSALKAFDIQNAFEGLFTPMGDVQLTQMREENHTVRVAGDSLTPINWNAEFE